VEQGRLTQKAMKNLKLGQEIALPDGTKVKFDKVLEFVGLQVSHDPSQDFVLVFAVLMLVGLMGSLAIKRRRLWLRVTNDRHIVTLHHGLDGREWSRCDVQMEVSGYHHNVAGDFLSLRPGIYVAGAGEAVFSQLRFRALGNGS